MKHGKRALVLFSMMICFACVSLISEVAYPQGYDNATVLKVQEELQAMGYNPGPLDGIWGRKTKRALKEFQYENGLSVTGKIDRPTKEKLGLITPDKAVAEPSVAKEVTKPSAPKDAGEPIVTEDAGEPIITEDAAEPRVPIETVENGIQAGLRTNWEIKTVQIKNGLLTIVPRSDVVTKDGYAAMVQGGEDFRFLAKAALNLTVFAVLFRDEFQGFYASGQLQIAHFVDLRHSGERDLFKHFVMQKAFRKHSRLSL